MTDPVRALDVSVTLLEAYDDDLFAERAGGTSTDQQERGYYTTLLTAATFSKRGDRLHYNANASSSLRYYAHLGGLDPVSHSAGGGLRANWGPRTSLTVAQTVAHSPSNLHSLFPRGPAAVLGESVPVQDYRIDDRESLAYSTDVGLTRSLGRRSTVLADFDYRYTDFVRGALRPDADSYGARVQVSRNAGRTSLLSVGYGFRSGNIGYGNGASRTDEHSLSIGGEFSKRLSPSRRASFSFNAGGSQVDIPDATFVDDGASFYRATVDVGLQYQFKLGWEARTSYRRGLEFVADLAEPVLTDGVTAGIVGLLTRRAELTTSASYATGGSALNPAAVTFDTYAADVRLRYALSSGWAAHFEYLYYFYDFGNGAQLPFDRSPQLSRNGLRVGIALWLPIVRSGR